MNEQELNEIKARCEKATEGPWLITKINGEPVVLDYNGIYLDITEEDAAFIAHARTDIPALIAEVRRLDETISQLMRDNDSELHKSVKAEKEVEQLTAENARLRAALDEMKDLLDAYSQDGHDRPIAVAANIADEALKGGSQ